MAVNGDSGASLADVAKLRQQTYLLFGSLFYHPDDELVAKIAAAAGELGSMDELARDFPFHRQWSDLLGTLAGLSGEGASELRQEYVGLFRVSTAAPICPLYESAHLDRKGGQAGWIVAQVQKTYSAGGLGLSEMATGESPDHIGLELEFMSLLCEREGEARLDGRGDEVAETLVLEGSFLEQHLGRWLALLEDCIRRTAAEGSLYRQLGSATLAFVAHDRELVGALTTDSPVVQLQTREYPSAAKDLSQ